MGVGCLALRDFSSMYSGHIFFSVQCCLILIYYFSMEKLIAFHYFPFLLRTKTVSWLQKLSHGICLLEKVIKYFLFMSSFEKMLNSPGMRYAIVYFF